MKHPAVVELCQYADEALDAMKHTQVQAHIEACPECARQVHHLREETRLLRVALQVAPVQVPAFRRPLGALELLRAVVILAGFAWILAWVWQALFSGEVRNIIGWFKPSALTESISLSIQTVFFVSEEGSNMISTLYTIALSALAVGLAYWWMAGKPKLRTSLGAVCLLALAGMAVPEPASAMEIRREDRGDSLTISAGEVIDDSLTIAGQTILVEGDVNGDLIAAGQRVIITGNVSGNLIVFAQNVSVRGTVDGSLLGFAATLDVEGDIRGSMMSFSSVATLTGASVMQDIWSYAGSIRLDRNSHVAGNATMFTGNATLDGNIGRDLTGFGDRMEISGEVGEDVETWIRTLALFDGSLIGGDLNYRSREANSLQRADGAVINGSVNFDNTVYEFTRPNPYATVKFYLHQLLRLGAGFLAGLCLFSLLPSLQQVSLSRGMEGLKAAGVGLLTLVSAPVVAGILAVTIIGLPLSVITLFGWALVWYFAKIMLAFITGSLLLSNYGKQNMPLKLFTGLVVVIVVMNLPVIGIVLSVCMTWIGAGLLIMQGYGYLQRRNSLSV